MFNFDPDRYLSIQTGAVAAAAELRALVGGLLGAGKARIHFAGAGGAAILMAPAVRLLRDRTTFPVHDAMTAEILISGDPHLGPESIVIIPSLSGTTGESVELAEMVRAKGATVIALTGHPDTPLGKASDHVLINFAEDDTSCESFFIQSLAIALAVLEARGELDGADALFGQFEALPTALLEAKRTFEPRAQKLARDWANRDYHIFTGAGLSWPEAYYYGMCILEEMQWIRTRPVHASDFFHGTLELVENGTSVVIFKGEDQWRPLTDRVEAFARQYTDTVTVLDAADFALPGIGPDLRPLVSQAVHSAVLERLSAHLEHLRDHPLTTRRYYRRVKY
ncbi:SIS domain-containing protein [Pelagibacterium montanilacus]|uniref:SIS domain-containing protein n=1 Tax=Pelagibacterium montanilacus TaxID=2185280 RepID=UPI000F8E06BC|nr:SIS domain-containing protein [Pelagibacterium montanilacus]